MRRRAALLALAAAVAAALAPAGGAGVRFTDVIITGTGQDGQVVTRCLGIDPAGGVHELPLQACEGIPD